MNNPSLLSCAANLASPAPFHRMLLLFWVILRAWSWMSFVCVLGFFFQMKLVTCYLQLYRLCMSCFKGGLSCLSAAVSSFVFALRQTQAETPPPTLRFSLPDILTGHSLAATLATLAHLRGNYTRAAVCCVNRSRRPRRRFSQGAGCVVLGFSSLLSGAGPPPLFVNISNPLTLVCQRRMR